MLIRNPAGKYSCDLNHCHKNAKPALLKEFKKMKNFTKSCGGNLDFNIDRKGMVIPNPTKKGNSNNCTKKNFSLDLNDHSDIKSLIGKK
ncbi:hypothetical protein FISHEDRAFT_73311 [Fistulina hepatica ATCC 64428]|uniref:Uncharacterized protein n=1 Tax=Fistulina hepatica ATCC 64428 TaxID=1128425 RepID=A0A0D7ADP6_9AGAR|nr:hypothetical protein FISHEDRAFT_73311 [Fistulina hepatica ATCC 64428]